MSDIEGLLREARSKGASKEQLESLLSAYEGTDIEKKNPLSNVTPIGTQPLPIGSKPFLPQVSTKIPSVLTPKGQVGYQEQVKDFKPIVQKPIFESAKAKQQRESGYENIAPLLSGLQSTVSSFYKIPRYIYDVFAIPQNLVADLANVPELKANYDNVSKGALNPLSYLEYAGDYTKGKAKEWESKQRKYDEDITTQLFKSGDYGGAGLQIYDNVIASAPSIAAMFLSGGVANAAKLGSASSKIATALPFASAQNQVLLENQEIPDWLKPVNAAFNGLSEILLEGKFGTTAILSGATKIAAEKGADAAIKSTKDFVYNYIKKALSKVQPVTDVVSNAAEEMATTLSQNIIARATGEDPNRGIMDGVFDAGIVGGAQGAGASAIRKGLDVLANKKSKGKVDDLTKKRDDIVNDLDNDAIPDSVKEQLEISLEGINQEINNTLDENRNEINNLPEETKLEVAELADKIETINESLQNETISETSKTILEQDLKDAQAELDAKFKLAKPTFDTEEQLIEEGKTAEDAEIGKPEELEPIRQLGTGANVYFETEKYRVNDTLKNGKVLLNIQSQTSEIPIANIEFDNANDAVIIAQELNNKFPDGVPDAILIDKYIEQLKNDLLKPQEDAVQEQGLQKSIKSTTFVDEEIKPDLIPEGSQKELRVDSKTIRNFKEKDTVERNNSSIQTWLESISRNDKKEKRNEGEELFGESVFSKESQAGVLLDDIYRKWQSLRAQTLDESKVGQDIGTTRTRTSLEQQRVGQQNRELAIIDELRAQETSQQDSEQGNISENSRKKQVEAGRMVEKILELSSLPNDPKKASVARALRDLLSSSTQKEKELIINEIKNKLYAVSQSISSKVPVLTEATVGEEVEQGKPEPKAEVVTEEGKEVVSTTVLDKIPRGNTFQERLAPDYYEKLKKDIKENGIKEPIILTYYPKDNALRLSDGHHRLAIAKELGIKDIPTKVNVVWRESIKDNNWDIEGQPIYNAPKTLDIESYRKRDYFPSNVRLDEIGLATKPEATQEQTPAQQVEQLRAEEQAIKAVDYKGKKISDVKIGDVYYDYYAGAIRKFERLPNREKENGEEVYFSKVVDENIFSEGSPDDVIGFNESDYLKSRPAETFLENAENLFYKNPFSDVLEVFGNDGKQVGWVALNKVDSDTVDVDGVVSITGGKRKGGGSQIMKMVTKNADRTGVTLTLVPEPLPRREAKGFETPEKLQAFYEKFGFVKDKKKPTMTRKPQPVLPQTIEEQIAELRIREEVELRKAIEYNEKYQTDFKIDRAKITDAKDLKKFDDIYDKYDKLITPLLPKKEAPAKAEPKLKSKVATRLLFKKAVDLFYDISGTEGSAKKRTISAKRRTFMEQNPSIKYIDDNWPNISKQLKEKGLLEKSKGCP